MGFAGYVAVCVQLYCRCFLVLHLVVTVYTTCFGLHGHLQVCRIFLLSYSWRNLLRWVFFCLFLHVVTLCTFPVVFFVLFFFVNFAVSCVCVCLLAFSCCLSVSCFLSEVYIRVLPTRTFTLQRCLMDLESVTRPLQTFWAWRFWRFDAILCNVLTTIPQEKYVRRTLNISVIWKHRRSAPSLSYALASAAKRDLVVI
jgi:hypothetical protein